MNIGRWTILAGVALNTGLAFAGPHKVVDLRNQSDANGEYEISLCARPSPGSTQLPGHAFVSYMERKANGPIQFAAVGLTTDSVVKGLLSYSALLATPQGYLNEESYSSVKEQCLVILVNKADFEKAYGLAFPFANVPGMETLRYTTVYSLTKNDCVTFMSSVAGQFVSKGIKLPKRETLDLPLDYLRKVIDAN